MMSPGERWVGRQILTAEVPQKFGPQKFDKTRTRSAWSLCVQIAPAPRRHPAADVYVSTARGFDWTPPFVVSASVQSAPDFIASLGFVTTGLEPDMQNSWLKKNPLMSMWLSEANRIAALARVQAAAQAKRQIKAAAGKATTDNLKTLLDVSVPALPKTTPKRRR